MSGASAERSRVLVVGGGVAALEAVLALRDLAGDRVASSLLAPDPEFVYRPLTVREPFSFSVAKRYQLEDIARDVGAELIADRFESLDSEHRVVRTETGRQLQYDALVLGMGAGLRAAFEHSLTINDRELDEQLHGLIQDLEDGYIHRLAFVAPSPMPWPLPMYELALMAARRAYDMGVDVSTTIVTPEEGPLAVFGTTASERVAQLLEEHGIMVITAAHAEVPEPGRIAIRPGERELHADRIIALPQLVGPSLRGIPAAPPDGFIPVDEHSQVRGLDHVWAAGDATDFPVKMGGIAAQQADVAAAQIAALTGSGVRELTFDPEIHAILLGLRQPLYLSAKVTGGHGETSQVSETPTWSPPSKIAAKYLAPYLEMRDRMAGRAA